MDKEHVKVKCRDCGLLAVKRDLSYTDSIRELENEGWRWHSGTKAHKGWRCPAHASPVAARNVSPKKRRTAAELAESR